ncbi:ABC bile acid transporter [Penicillium angulare]|uniref:ABC bile acid transporter n=1 Tax=Penicillium angulare TaxID=116970 RepID=UPI0025425D8D|nr:ABC bile acid transporter [Penicillium angulare]KAJ5273912.1 ABC bile acid transporter [Penicillium angulare]
MNSTHLLAVSQGWDSGLKFTKAIALGAITLLSIPAGQSLFSEAEYGEKPKHRNECQLYEDEDGQATFTSMQEFSQSTQATLSLIMNIMGCVVCFNDSKNALIDRSGGESLLDHQLQMAIWVLLLIQCVAIWREPQCTNRFALGLQASVCQLLSALSLSAGLYSSVKFDQSIRMRSLFQLGVSIAACGCHLLTPRRPHVFRNGVLVSPESTVSLISRMTFMWMSPWLAVGKLPRALEVSDTHEIPQKARSLESNNVFMQTRVDRFQWTRTNLLWTLLRLHSVAFTTHLICTLLVTSFNFIPQASLFATLRTLEEGSRQGPVLWLYVAGLAIPPIISAPFDAYKYWVAHSTFILGTRQYLTPAIFSKALTLNGKLQTKKSTEWGDSDSAHRIVNLMTVDTTKCGLAFNTVMQSIWTSMNLLVSVYSLIGLLGWHSALTAIVVVALTFLVSSQATKIQSTARRETRMLRDKRLSSLTEVFRCIKMAKIMALEKQWEEKVKGVRDAELQKSHTILVWDLFTRSLYLITPTLLSVLLLGTHAWIYGEIKPAKAFAVISMLNTVQTSMSAIPGIIPSFMESLTGAEHLAEFLNAPARIQQVIQSDTIEFRNASISGPGGPIKSGKARLEDLSLQFPQGSLSLITGPTGSGKSLLLASILGECHLHGGTIHAPIAQPWDSTVDSGWLNDSIAYVAQSPWIEAATVKDNILFGLPYDSGRYNQVIHACALQPDLNSFQMGDLAEVWANGANLSGGQQWRLTMARALYSRARVLVIDDIFSAVDVHTARHLYEHTLTGPLSSGRTRLLATHSLGLCSPRTAYLVCLDQGRVSFAGTVEGFQGVNQLPVARIEPSSDNPTDFQESRLPDSIHPPQAVEKEPTVSSMHQWSKFWMYTRSSGTTAHWILTLIIFVAYGIALLSQAWWLGEWSTQLDDLHDSQFNGQERTHPALRRGLAIYLGLSGLLITLSVARIYAVSVGAWRASRRLFRIVLARTLAAPTQWVNTMSLGTILDMFSADFDTVDTLLSTHMQDVLTSGVDVIIALTSATVTQPRLLPAVFILATFAIHDTKKYLAAARKVKRLEDSIRGPIINYATSCLQGISTIRAYGKTEQSLARMGEQLEERCRASRHIALLKHWLAVRTDILGAFFVSITASVMIGLPNVDAASVGFVITFANQLAQSFKVAIYRYQNFELDLDPLGRVLDYTQLETEGGEDRSSTTSTEWPSTGAIEVSGLVAQHGPDLPPVLNGITFRVEANQRVGIVGRTGAGKSSIALALLRMLSITQGHIMVDGVDIATLHPQRVRSRLAMIPQDPMLTKGTIRSNLDPFDEFGDQQLVHALSLVGWHGVAGKLAMNEDKERSALVENTENLSQGQRQVLCIARAIVRNSKVLILDEATSAMDKVSEAKVLQSLRSACQTCSSSLLVIAHRLSTIVDFDRIIVLSDGRVQEYGRPCELIQIEGGSFRGMVEKDIERDVLFEKIIGQKA